jgi:hypothetical protein
MRARVKMRECVDTVAPGLFPAIAREQFLEYGGGIVFVRQAHSRAIT